MGHIEVDPSDFFGLMIWFHRDTWYWNRRPQGWFDRRQNPPGLHEMQLVAGAVNQSQTMLEPQCFTVKKNGILQRSMVMRGPFANIANMECFVELADRLNSSSDKAWCLDVVNIHGLDIINVSIPSKAHQNMLRKTQPPSVLMRQWRKETRKTGSGDTWHNDNYHRPYTVYRSHANHPPLEVGCQFMLFLVGPDARWDQRDPSRPAINL